MSWDDFLTERDRQHLSAGWQKTEPFGLGTRPAVLVVDVYYKALGLEREPLLESIKKWPLSCGLDGWAAVDQMVPLLAAARRADVPVIYLQRMDPPLGARWARQEHPPRPSVPLTDDEAARSHEIVAEVAPHDGDLVLQKAAPSAFQGTPLEFTLNYHGIDTVLVCGETTSGCVRATVVDAATLRFRVGVVGDCCFDRTQASHHLSLFDMNQEYADILTVADATAYLTTPARRARW